MSLDLMRLVCNVKYITRGYVIVGYAHVSVVDVIRVIKFSNTSNGLFLSQSHERCEDSPMRTPYAKSVCVFWEVSINLNKHVLLDTCASYLYILVGLKIFFETEYHEAVALKWKYFYIRKQIRNQLFMWRANKLRVHRGEWG